MALETLPVELIFNILFFLEPAEIAPFRAVSKRFWKIGTDNDLWRRICFNRSSSEIVRQRAAGSTFQASLPFQAHPSVQEFRRRTQAALSAHQAWVGAASNSDATDSNLSEPQPYTEEVLTRADAIQRDRATRLANWDPTYQGEQVNWWSEYIARHGPVSCSWFQPARAADASPDSLPPESRGLALLGSDFAIAPLEDDSIAIWVANSQNHEQRGHLIARSKPGLFSGGPKKETTINPTSASAISVDDRNQKAYIAVQEYLQEIDINTLQVSNSQKFPVKIAALSDFTTGTPLTVGTRSAVHIYDPRERVRQEGDDASEHADPMSTYPKNSTNGSDFSVFTSGNYDRFASLHQAGPTAIQHLFRDNPGTQNGDIVVSGRFPSLLVYDRRSFPKLRTTLYSGAQLCDLTALPYGYSSVDSEIMRRGELPINAAQEARSRPGHTLFACGEYGGKGALEIYGLSDQDGQQAQTSTFKNRVSAARAKVLSIANHGSRLIISDAEGGIRWLERDGQTLIRRWNINHFEWHGDRMINMAGGPSDGEAALKLVPLFQTNPKEPYLEDGVLVWTGERVGMLSFSHQPKFGGPNGEAWDEIIGDSKDAIRRREEKVYGETMRRALEGQADEVRWMSGLGLGG